MKLVLYVSETCCTSYRVQLERHWTDTVTGGAQWLSWYIVRLGIEGLLVRASPPVESLYCVLEQDTSSTV